jgi:hypothetical protein
MDGAHLMPYDHQFEPIMLDKQGQEVTAVCAVCKLPGHQIREKVKAGLVLHTHWAHRTEKWREGTPRKASEQIPGQLSLLA